MWCDKYPYTQPTLHSILHYQNVNYRIWPATCISVWLQRKHLDVISSIWCFSWLRIFLQLDIWPGTLELIFMYDVGFLFGTEKSEWIAFTCTNINPYKFNIFGFMLCFCFALHLEVCKAPLYSRSNHTCMRSLRGSSGIRNDFKEQTDMRYPSISNYHKIML